MAQKLSVIIPTYNAAPYLPQLITQLQTQTVPFELIIIDSSSNDGSKEFLQKAADIFIEIPKESFDHGGTRTKALSYANGEYVLFCTQDALAVSNNVLEKLINTLDQNDDIAVVYARQLPYEHSSLFGKHLRYFNYPKHSYIRSLQDKERFGLKTAFLSNSCAMYRKKHLKEAGAFDPNLIVGEDAYAGAKLLLQGYKIAYNADAHVYHSHSYTLYQEFQRYFDIGVFHTTQAWLIETFGKAEGEGMRYIKSELNYLLEQKAYLHIPQFFIRNGLKLLGYKLGKNYKKLPKKLSYLFSMHKSWWKN